MKLGIHSSVRGGLLPAFERAVALGCRTLQIFPRKPRSPVMVLSHSQFLELKTFQSKNSIDPVIVHGYYQPNIASTNQKVRERSKQSLQQEIKFAETIGAQFFVIHSGNYSADSSLAEGLKISAETIRSLLQERASGIRIVIENVGGGCRRIGGKFEELAALLEEIGSPDRTGICLDTAHAYASGFPLETLSGMESCLAQLDQKIGLNRVLLFHLNDSAADRGSHKDIHATVGSGRIGLLPLQKLLRDPRFPDTPAILEMPRTPGSLESSLQLLRE